MSPPSRTRFSTAVVGNLCVGRRPGSRTMNRLAVGAAKAENVCAVFSVRCGQHTRQRPTVDGRLL